MLLFPMRSTTENNKITHEKKFWIHEIPTRNNLELTKHSREKIWDQRNTHEKKFGTQ